MSSPTTPRTRSRRRWHGLAGEPTQPTTSPWIRVSDSAIHGRGVYAAVPIPAGTRIIEYVGELITKREAQRREDERLARAARGEDGCVYIFELNKRHDIDGGLAWNTARLINHSCAPNARADTLRGHIWILAKRDIAVGEEITFDYGYPFVTWQEHPCRCGARGCVGYIVNRAQRWRVRDILKKRAMQARRLGRVEAKA